ncbi:hypothetical protein D3OALGA1CA_2648 [Olavius algarvensis associated proteobacterium Delta 3]|nr:hypothetical protein D3OALGA1CA_2648 [Olavius algarvensis associated proteobacterium Delta 3]CAB5132023.1 hypothetical protein D3OALGB2SA_3698 [Olavius algarvensis associated proteobacterium Delta 3]
MAKRIESTVKFPEHGNEQGVRDASADFLSLFYSVVDLRRVAEQDPERITVDSILSISSVLMDGRYSNERRGLFLYREVAEALAAFLERSFDTSLARLALDKLMLSLKNSSGFAHRATAEALGRLPVKIRPFGKTPDIDSQPLKLTWRRIQEHFSIRPEVASHAFGRSLVTPISGGLLLVLKFARREDLPGHLLDEIQWMRLLGGLDANRKDRFDIPKPVTIDGHYLLQIGDSPMPGDFELHPGRYAVGFVSTPEYYCYPNTLKLSEAEIFQEIISRNARLLADLATTGVIHTAPIPLFHNRVQTHRRRDEGVYEWFRGGRLDRWLESCAYPNLGASGIRDFEHFTFYEGRPLSLYRYIGSHILSLMLVIGSFFRHQDAERVGLDAHGNPVDARDLFDRDLLESTIKYMITGYYSGFVGEATIEDLPLDVEPLVDRMIDEMGVDRHMEEILRVADQMHMSDAEFEAFLQIRGFSPNDQEDLIRGERDITLFTGPHLGNFNDTISLPELTSATETISALCMAGRYWKENHESDALSGIFSASQSASVAFPK